MGVIDEEYRGACGVMTIMQSCILQGCWGPTQVGLYQIQQGGRP